MRFENVTTFVPVQGSATIADGRTGHGASPSASPSLRLETKAQEINGSQIKRLIDIAGAGAALVTLLPLFLIVAAAIRLDSSGPVLFRQQRYGTGRRPFVMYKFRSMTVMESTGAFQQATATDHRVTRVGRFLRRTSIDELPQLINVLRGEMSLVGPRPHATAMDDTYAGIVANYADRHLVRPGLTGLAQVSGLRGPTDALVKIEDRVRRDRAYIRTWSITRDIKIIIKTPATLLGPNAF